MRLTFSIHDLVQHIQDLENVLHEVDMEHLKIYSFFPRIAIDVHNIHMKNVEILPRLYIPIPGTLTNCQGYHRTDHLGVHHGCYTRIKL